MGSLENPFYGRVLEDFSERVYAHGRRILMAPADHDRALDPVAARLTQHRLTDTAPTMIARMSPRLVEREDANGHAPRLIARVRGVA